MLAQSPEAAKQEAPAAGAPKGGKKEKPHPGDIVIERPGSDFMLDESIINYGGNRACRPL